MTPLILVEEITKSFGDRLLFADVTFGINEGDKIAIVAKNGTGKSTLLSIIGGKMSPDSGKVTLRSGVRIGFLDQDSVFDGDKSVYDCILSDTDLSHIEAWDKGDAVKRMLSQVGLDEDAIGRPASRLSGGQLKRAALAKVLLEEPDVLILDEPTNHLDIDTVEWLENYLTRKRVTLLMVTHDRYFLDRVCNKIIEIDQREIFTYEGNFDYYLRKRRERLEAQEANLAKMKNTLRREQEWMNRQPQARAGKARYRINAFYDLREKARADYSEKDADPTVVKSAYIGSKIFEAENVCKSFGSKVILKDFTYTFARYEKLGIIGGNGVGKSTFFKTLVGLESIDSGSWNIGETVRFGYYSQDNIQLPEGKKVIDAVTDIADDIVLGEGDGATRLSPMQFLSRFLFSPADCQKYVATLSGGERRRLHLATVLMRNPNFLILDEPTNDLDIMTLGVLESYVRDFKGCVIVVSHDRYFLDTTVDHLFVMEGDGVIKDFPGTFSEYRECLKELQSKKDTAEKAPRKTSASTSQRPLRLTYKEKKELEALTEEIDKLTEEKTAIEARFNSGETLTDVAELSRRYDEVRTALDEKEMRWLELSEKE